MKPLQERQDAHHDAEDCEADHGPFEGGGIDDVDDLAAEPDGEKAKDKKAYGSAGRNTEQKAEPWVPERAKNGNDHGEGKRRRGETAHEYRNEAALADFALQIAKSFFAGNALHSLLADFA
jgi:hypothetical protein